MPKGKSIPPSRGQIDDYMRRPEVAAQFGKNERTLASDQPSRGSAKSILPVQTDAPLALERGNSGPQNGPETSAVMTTWLIYDVRGVPHSRNRPQFCDWRDATP
jgi:hypothetical protein